MKEASTQDAECLWERVERGVEEQIRLAVLFDSEIAPGEDVVRERLQNIKDIFLRAIPDQGVVRCQENYSARQKSLRFPDAEDPSSGKDSKLKVH